MSDLIKREDAIDAIECVTWYHQNRNKDMVSGANSAEHQAWYKAEDIYDALESVPSADRPQEWIPCSERMPNKQSDYLVTISLYDNSTYVDVLHFHKGKFYEIDSEWGDVEYDDVTAWMPLPKPWKGADDD